MKRLIVGCDGTWMDGFSQLNENFYTNVLRITRAVLPTDARSPASEAVVQIAYYGTGVGAEPNLASDVAGAIGTGLATKVQEAYSFICMNWQPGDEICLFGFSRGAYTARIVASIIDEIGILRDKVDLESFPALFLAFQNAGKHPQDALIQQRVAEELAPFKVKREHQVAATSNGFLIKVVGVFDTVGAIGLPEEIIRREPALVNVFGFNDTLLGDHIEFAFQALALNETRADFSPTKWIQTAEGRAKGQTLRQVWFAGSHADIGGGWQVHDLADLTLSWMIAETESMIAYELDYIEGIPDRTYAWGKQPPHNPRTGVMALTLEQIRTPPTATDQLTHEYIHASVREQTTLTSAISSALESNPALVPPLLPFEQTIRTQWATGPQQRVRPAQNSLARGYTLNATLPVELNQTTPIIQFLYNQLVLRIKNAEFRVYAFASRVVPGGQDTLHTAAHAIEHLRLEANDRIGKVSDGLFGRFFPRNAS